MVIFVYQIRSTSFCISISKLWYRLHVSKFDKRQLFHTRIPLIHPQWKHAQNRYVPNTIPISSHGILIKLTSLSNQLQKKISGLNSLDGYEILSCPIIPSCLGFFKPSNPIDIHCKNDEMIMVEYTYLACSTSLRTFCGFSCKLVVNLWEWLY